MERIREYHQKPRDFVWVRWIQSTSGYPSIAMADLDVKTVFEEITYPYHAYYLHATQHLNAYRLMEERQGLLDRIKEHNEKAGQFDKKRRRGGPLTGEMEKERDQLGAEQMKLWSQIQGFATRLQEVVNNLEDGILLGECDFEKRLKKESGISW